MIEELPGGRVPIKLWTPQVEVEAQAYKNIDDVMNNQKDLVKIIAQLRQVLCVKG